MDTSNLESRVAKLETSHSLLARELRLALNYIQSDAASSLTKSRMVLEKVVLAVFKAEMGQEPRKPLLGEMLADNQFTRKIERRILSRMNAIRDMGNLGPHGEAVEPVDAVRVLDDLCEVLEWSWQRMTPPVAAPPAAPISQALHPILQFEASVNASPHFQRVAVEFEAANPADRTALAKGIAMAYSEFKKLRPDLLGGAQSIEQFVALLDGRADPKLREAILVSYRLVRGVLLHSKTMRSHPLLPLMKTLFPGCTDQETLSNSLSMVLSVVPNIQGMNNVKSLDEFLMILMNAGDPRNAGLKKMVHDTYGMLLPIREAFGS